MKKYELVTVADVIEFGRDFREIIKSKSLDELRQWAKDRDSKGQLSDIVMAASFGASYEKILTDKEYETFKDYNWRQFVLSPDEKEKAQYKDISSRVEGNVIIPPLTFPYGVEKIWFSLKTEQELKSELLEACAKGDIDTVSSLVESGSGGPQSPASGVSQGSKPAKKSKSKKKKSEEPVFDL